MRFPKFYSIDSLFLLPYTYFLHSIIYSFFHCFVFIVSHFFDLILTRFLDDAHE